MRILHTSDWHIGRRFEREPLEADQRAFLEWLADRVEEHAVDLVVVAGDVFDRSLPAEDAVALLDDGLERLRAAGATVVLIPGNHDSARRLGFGARRQALGGVHVFADDHAPPVPWLFEAAGEAVAVVAVPFLDPLALPPPAPGPGGEPRARTHAHALEDALAAGRAALAAYPGVPSFAVAHAHVVGGAASDSERLLAVGGADAVDARVVAGFDYVALGHLHRPQCVGGDERLVYSGSPIPYSFSEEHDKSVRLVEVDGGEVASVRELGVPVGRRVATLEGTLDELLADPAHDGLAEHWVAARLTDRVAQVQPLERLRTRFPHAVAVRYACELAPPGRVRPTAATAADAPRPVEEVVLDFVAEVRGDDVEGWERELVLRAVEAARAEEGAA